MGVGGRSGGVGGLLIRGWALRKFSAFRMGAYSRWTLIRGWALIRINTVSSYSKSRNSTDVCMVGGGEGHKLAPHQTNVCKFSQLAR